MAKKKAEQKQALPTDHFIDKSKMAAGATITDTEIRARCIEAASRAMMRGPAQGETAQTFAGFLFGLADGFYSLAMHKDAANALRGIDAAATGMMNAKLPGQASQLFAGDVLGVAEEYVAFAIGDKLTLGKEQMKR